jgi:hypothetical protein
MAAEGVGDISRISRVRHCDCSVDGCSVMGNELGRVARCSGGFRFLFGKWFVGGEVGRDPAWGRWVLYTLNRKPLVSEEGATNYFRSEISAAVGPRFVSFPLKNKLPRPRSDPSS